MRKKFLTTMLSLAMVASLLVGCGVSSNEEKDSSTTVSQTV